MTSYQKRMSAAAERRRQIWRDKKEQVRQWLVDNEAPQDILALLDEVARVPIYSWC